MSKLRFGKNKLLAAAEVWSIKQVSLSNAHEDMVLAKDVLDDHGRVLLSAGAQLREESIRLLGKHTIQAVWIKSENSKANRQLAAVPSLIDAAKRVKLLGDIESAFTSDVALFHQLPLLQVTVTNIVDDLRSRPDLLIYLSDISHKSEYLFIHSVNVGVFAITIGLAMNLPVNDVVCLGIGGLLHDLGKIKITKEIIDKRGPLAKDEFEQIKEHARYGYNILRRNPAVDHRILLTALQHHERHDGNGYPWGLSGNEVYPLARIAAVADVYDALTTDRVYRTRIHSADAIRMINEGAGTQFDPQVVAAFNKVAVPYTIGSGVMLNNGRPGAVVRLNSANPSRPVVWTSNGIVDLLEEADFKIASVI